MSKKARPTRRRKQAAPKASVGASVAEFLQRRLTGQEIPRGHFGPVDESLVSQLKQRLAAAEKRQ